METYKHLDLAWSRDQFRAKPTHKLAQWYLQNLMRSRHSDKIDDDEYLDGLREIKDWVNGQKGG